MVGESGEEMECMDVMFSNELAFCVLASKLIVMSCSLDENFL